MENFDFINSFIPGEKDAKMSIRRPIDRDGRAGINGDDFAREMEFLEASGVENVTIDINSIGGSIKEGFSIFSAIKDTSMNTTTRVVGIAASMAGMISQAGNKRVILDFGIFHAHGVQVPKGKKADAQLVNIMKESLKTILSSRAGLSDEKAEEMLSKETVLTAVEAKNAGFFDEIEVTRGSKPVLNVENSVESLFEMVNKFETNKKQMEKVVEFLALENATEETVLTAVTELKAEAAKVEELENTLAEKTAKVEELEASISELSEVKEKLELEKATNLVEGAVKAGKIKEEAKELFLEKAKNDLEGTKALLDGIVDSAKAEEISNELETEEANADERKGWDYQKWGQEDPTGLNSMRINDPEKFEALLNEYLEAK